jgi:class 3 adenylate cyclase/pimeloyl-ACP methyl ester carboxylesterase
MTDAPPVQYARTSDGVNIAFWTYGKGPPLVLMPLLIGSHVQIDWSVPARVAAFERLARGATVIRYDSRGMGMSDREPIDFSPEAGMRDLESVVDKLGVERFAILSQHVTGEAGLKFAAAHPERVAAVAHRIVLAVGPRADAVRRIGLIRPLMDQDWELYTQILGRLLAGWSDPESSVLGSIICSAHTPASFRAVTQYSIANPSSDQLAEIQTPVLLLHAIGDETEAGLARRMAAALSDCRVVAIPKIGYGSSGESLGGPYPNEVGLTAVLEFIAAPEKGKVEVRTDVGLRTILWTDLVEHTQMMTRLGDERGRQVLREHERITREALKAHGGSEVKTMGDGFMASFTSVTKAVECALALQKAIDERNRGVGASHPRDETTSRQREQITPRDDVPTSVDDSPLPAVEPIAIRIGLNAGEPVEDEGDLFGTTVILAARIAAIADAGEILVSDVIRQLLSGKGFLFNDRGEHPLKGFEEPVRVYEVRRSD